MVDKPLIQMIQTLRAGRLARYTGPKHSQGCHYSESPDAFICTICVNLQPTTMKDYEPHLAILQDLQLTIAYNLNSLALRLAFGDLSEIPTTYEFLNVDYPLACVLMFAKRQNLHVSNAG